MTVLAVVGRTTRDLVDSLPPRPGGVPFHAARALQLMGERGVIVTRCAAADRRQLLAPLAALDMPIEWEAEPSTAVFRLVYREGKRQVTIESLGDPWRREDVGSWLAGAVRSADWVHVGALWRDEFPPETLAELAHGRRLSLDGHGLVRPGRVGPVVADANFDPATLADVDLLHLSEGEVAALGLTLDGDSLRTLGVPEIVVTIGERGSIVCAEGLVESVPARPVPGVDPTGAGDAFTAAYIAARRKGEAPAAAARLATELLHELLAGRRLA